MAVVKYVTNSAHYCISTWVLHSKWNSFRVNISNISRVLNHGRKYMYFSLMNSSQADGNVLFALVVHKNCKFISYHISVSTFELFDEICIWYWYLCCRFQYICVIYSYILPPCIVTFLRYLVMYCLCDKGVTLFILKYTTQKGNKRYIYWAQIIIRKFYGE